VLAQAVRRIMGSGAVIRTYAPLIRSINDDPGTWRAKWRTAVPLAHGYETFRDAYQGVSGLGCTVRGTSMSLSSSKGCRAGSR
jgi:hypothetical protein